MAAKAVAWESHVQTVVAPEHPLPIVGLALEYPERLVLSIAYFFYLLNTF